MRPSHRTSDQAASQLPRAAWQSYLESWQLKAAVANSACFFFSFYNLDLKTLGLVEKGAKSIQSVQVWILKSAIPRLSPKNSIKFWSAANFHKHKNTTSSARPQTQAKLINMNVRPKCYPTRELSNQKHKHSNRLKPTQTNKPAETQKRTFTPKRPPSEWRLGSTSVTHTSATIRLASGEQIWVFCRCPSFVFLSRKKTTHCEELGNIHSYQTYKEHVAKKISTSTLAVWGSRFGLRFQNRILFMWGLFRPKLAISLHIVKGMENVLRKNRKP